MRKLWIDIDGVLADCVGATLENTNRRYGLSMTHEDVTEWDIAQSICEAYHSDYLGRDLSEGEVVSYILGLWDGGLFAELDVIQGLGGRLNRLGPKHYITNRPAHTMLDTAVWLSVNIGHVSGAIHCTDKCDHLKPGDILVDDNADTCIKAAEMGVKVCCLAWPWNEGMPEHENIVRCADWPAIVEAVKAWEVE